MTDPATLSRVDTSGWPATNSGRLAAAGALFLAWTLFGLLSSAHFFFGYEGATDLGSFLYLADNVIVFYWGWALLTPLVLIIAQRIIASGTGRARQAVLLVVAAVGVMLLHGIVHTSLVLLFGLAHKPAPGLSRLGDYAMRHGGGDIATFGVIVGVYLLFEANRRARARELAAAELSTRLASADLELLRWNLHPHFLFNALNTVSTLVLKGENEQAGTAISMISRHLRASIAQHADSLVPLADDIDMLKRYVEIEKLRFGSALTLDVEADNAALDSLIPGSILQPLVENAIAHGRVREPGAGPIRISAESNGHLLRLEVSNPAAGGIAPKIDAPDDGDTPDTGRFGLRYVRERLRQFYGERATFELASEGERTVAKMSIPLERSPNA